MELTWNELLDILMVSDTQLVYLINTFGGRLAENDDYCVVHKMHQTIDQLHTFDIALVASERKGHAE